MKRYGLFLTVICSFLSFCFVSPAFGSVAEDENRNQILSKVNSLPIPFIENVGQITNDSIMYYAKTFGGNVSITKDGRIIYSIPRIEKEKDVKGWVISESFVGASISKLKGEDKSITRVNYFKGKVQSNWKKNILTYDLLSFGEIYEGIELKLKAYGNNVEKLFFLKPNTDPNKILVMLNGTKALKVTEEGELELTTGLGKVKFTKPVAYQEYNGKRKYVQISYAAIEDKYSFKVGDYEKTKQLVIDPLLASTFIGGSDSYEDYIYRTLSIDPNGNVYVTGVAISSNFPTVPGAYNETFNGGTDAYVAKLDSYLENLLAATFLGGSGDEQGNSISVDSSGNVYISGHTTGTDFPTTTGAYDTTYNGATDAYVAKLDSNLGNLLASTLIGGSDRDIGRAITVDSAGSVYLTASTNSSDFPTTPGAFDIVFTGGYYNRDITISKFDSDLENLLASTFLGGSGPLDDCASIAIASDGSVYVGGGTSSTDFPTTPSAYDTVQNSNYWTKSAFISRFDSNLENILASTFIEGNIYGGGINSIAFDNIGNVYVAGSAKASDFPTTAGAYDTSYGGGVMDAFVSKLDANLTNLLASTYLGGSGLDRGRSISVDSSENVYVTGVTQSSDFPTTAGAYDITHNGGGYDIYISKLDSGLEDLLASTFIGGSNNDSAVSAALDDIGNVYAHGCTNSSDFPTTPGAYDPTYNSGEYNTFVIKLNGALSSNQSPAADAGPNIDIPGEDQNFTIICGTATDSDADPLNCRWVEGENELSPWQSVGPNGEACLDLITVSFLSMGEHTLTLEVNDGQVTSTDNMILTVDNSAPHAAPTGGGTYELYSPVTLGGQISDFDGDTLTYEWLESDVVLFSDNQPTIYGGYPVTFPEHIISDLSLGAHILTLRVNDGVNIPVSSDMTVEVIDETNPTLAPVSNKTILWPPTHKMLDIMIEANASDNSGGAVTLSASVSSNEPEDGLGDGDAAPDWTEPIIDQDNGIITLQLRSERSGSGEGRVYTITITTTDESGNSSTADVEIIVPHDKGKK